MSGRVSTDDLAAAELALRHEADTYDPHDPERASLLRVADWVYTQRQQRYRRMAERQLPDPLGFRQVTSRAPLPEPGGHSDLLARLQASVNKARAGDPR